MNNNDTGETQKQDFIRTLVNDDLASQRFSGKVQTRFPPEPNGHLHLGHAKSICLNFGLASEYGGVCNLRFDDTNPTTESEEFADSIRKDIEWLLGHELPEEPVFASNYFDQLYEWAERLVELGKAYVDDQTAEMISTQRGSFTEPGVNSPFRERSPEENLVLFRDMRTG